MNNAPPDPTILPSWFSRSAAARVLSGLFGAVLRSRNMLYDRIPALSKKALRPVVSIGGIRMGGTGKTPVALLVSRYLMSKNRPVAILSRGYGRRDAGLRIVKPHETVAWELIGDEPCMLHHRLPESWLGVHPHRLKSAATLARMVPERTVFVLDDGFQHRSIRRDLDIVCLHAPPESDRLAPAGNLREYASSLARAQIALFTGGAENAAQLEAYCSDLVRRYPHLKAFPLVFAPGPWVNAADGRTAAVPPLTAPVLVCGIARPERFIEMAGRTGITPAETIIFPDHHHYITNDFDKTRELYSNGILTTEKDAVRLTRSGIVPDEMLWYLTVEAAFADKDREKEFFALVDCALP